MIWTKTYFIKKKVGFLWKTLDVKSIMNILYDEKDIGRENKGFVCADDVKVVKEGK